MKKCTLVFFFSFLLFSCSKDSDSSTQNPGQAIDTSVLLKKTVTTSQNGESVTTNYTYDGKKLMSTSDSDGTVINYTYISIAGSPVIEKIEEIRNGIPYKTETLDYSSPIHLNECRWVLHEHGTQGKSKFRGGHEGAALLIDNYEGTTLINSGRLFYNGESIIRYEIGELNNPSVAYTYIYDLKNNPLRNIESKASFMIILKKGIINNITNYIKSGAVQSENYSASYTYNNNNYPLTATLTNQNSEITTIEYFYE